MMPFVHRFQPAVFHVCVNLRGADAGVSKHFLQGANLGAAGEHVRGETVSQCVRADPLAGTNSGRIFLHQFPHHHS